MMPLLTLQAVSRSFGGVQALDRVDLMLPERQVHALIGPNGAGKSTAGQRAHRLAAAFVGHGHVLRARHHWASGAPHRRRRHRPDVSGRPPVPAPQRHGERHGRGQHRLPAALLSGILPWPGARATEAALREQAMALLRRLGIAGLAGQPVGELPYGRRRLVEIARALATEPAVLLLDEPAAGLNSREAGELVEVLGTLKAGGLSTILIEHNMGLVMKVADRITVPNFGRRIAEGTPAEIRRDPQVLEAYLGHGYAHA